MCVSELKLLNLDCYTAIAGFVLQTCLCFVIQLIMPFKLSNIQVKIKLACHARFGVAEEPRSLSNSLQVTCPRALQGSIASKRDRTEQMVLN